MKRLIALLLLVAALAFAPHAEAFSLSLEPASQTIAVGDTATYTLGVSDFSAIFFTDYTVALSFDSSILSFDSANFITGTGTATFPGSPGFFLLEGVSLLTDPVSAPLDLVSLTFTGIGLGTTDLIIADNTFADLGTLDLFGADTVSDAQANVVPGPIPEPGTLILLGAGLAGLAVWRRRRP
ncbi:cohesin domain-containing protein [Geobacter grbiciae]|uniref:cohesin domain-containing protein n=1 Tax=Geobacter grbiciae TaxID=155042 RepID=UPI001C02C1B0|nr:cohesin domain-containing protein [Geobacter grbiciae]MBT1077085.1 cohesin domain-containing protein [Geobacter grbiciae]